jgi:hypothetical protein
MRALKTGTYETVYKSKNINFTDTDIFISSVSISESQTKHRTGKEKSE